MTLKRARMIAAASAVAGCFLVAACTSGGTVNASAPGQPSPSSGGSSRFEKIPSSSAPTSTQVDAAKLDAIRIDLTTRGVDVDDLQVVSSRTVTWSDGSWGCAEPGVQYTQALVAGAEVIVTASGKRYDYHFGADALRLCTRPHATITDNPNA